MQNNQQKQSQARVSTLVAMQQQSKWQCSKPNGDIQYGKIVQLPVANSHLDQYPWTSGSSKESAISVENLDIETRIVDLS